MIRISDHYQPWPRQREFHESPAKYRLFGGAAGPGKTMAILWEAVRQANRYPNVDTLLLRRSFQELEDSLLKEFRRTVPRDLFRAYNESKHLVTWHNGSTTRFGYLKKENDVYQYQGSEFLFVGFDELTLFTLKQWTFLTSRNRCKVAGTFPNMAGASNPGNIGHAWVKALWIDGQAAPGMEDEKAYDRRDYDFIRATIDDNPIYAGDSDYRRTLEKLPSHLRKAFLEGDWDIFAGQYFDVFESGRHTANVEGCGIQSWWPKWISVDRGFVHPSAVYWHTTDPHGRVITYREYVKDGLTARMLGEAIAERTDESEKILAVYLSPDAFGKKTSEHSDAEEMGRILRNYGLPEPTAAQDDRVVGWRFLYQLLHSDMAVITDNCKQLIQCIPTLVRDDPPREEDVRKMDGDDPADAWRYGLVTHLMPARLPLGEAVKQRIAAAEQRDGARMDPTSRAIWAQKYETEERKKAFPVKRKRFRGT